LLSYLKFLLKKKLISGGKVTESERKFIIQLQLNNVCEILDGEIKYSTLLDHTGDQKRRISITYKDKK